MSESPFESTAPYKLTLKAGKGFEDPWLSIEADSIEVLYDRLKSVNESAIFGLIGSTAKTLQAAYVTGSVLGGEPVNPPAEPAKAEEKPKATKKRAPAKTAAQKKAEAEAKEAAEKPEEEPEAPEAPEEDEKPSEEPTEAPETKARPRPKWRK